MKTQVVSFLLATAVVALLAVSTPVDAGQRGAARSSVNSGGGAARAGSANRPANANRGADGSRSANVNRNTEVNRNTSIERDVSVDVDVDHDNGCCFNDWDDREHHPVAVGAAVATTAAIIGSMVNTIPPSCVNTTVGGVAYYQCGSTWYQPQFNGGTTTYVVVNPP